MFQRLVIFMSKMLCMHHLNNSNSIYNNNNDNNKNIEYHHKDMKIQIYTQVQCIYCMSTFLQIIGRSSRNTAVYSVQLCECI